MSIFYYNTCNVWCAGVQRIGAVHGSGAHTRVAGDSGGTELRGRGLHRHEGEE